MENQNRQVLLKRRPGGAPAGDDFEIVDAPIPDPADGEALVRGIYLSLDPYMRGRMSAARSYARPVEVGAVMEGRVVGRVVRSRDPGFRAGDYVLGGYGWQLYSAVPANGLVKLEPNEAPLSTALGVLGMPGLTAYVGLSDIGRRHCRGCRQMPLCGRRTGLRRLHRPSLGRSLRYPRPRLRRRHRRLLGKCRRRCAAGCVSAAQ